MKTFFGLYNSSIGKKLVVGATGLFLCMYLVVHLLGNLLLFKHDGGAAFDQYAEILPSLLIIRIVEIGLFAVFLIHIVTATVLWILNRNARPERYELNRPKENSSFFSRTMFVSGSIVFIFIVIHMRSFWVTSRFYHEAYPSSYRMVVGVFSNPYYVVFYVVAIILLGFHLRHGFQSAFQTFGIKHARYAWLIELVGAIFWLVIPLAFVSIPIYFVMQ
jgi:succinate dehydrogenase / fumarate reductase cytochrome b subunit